MSKTTITAVIPTYQRPQETRRAVMSALEQTRPPEHLLVVDDGSSREVQEQLMDELPPLGIEVVLADHCGHPGRVRNIALGKIETTHIAFLDSDDVWQRDKLAVQASGVRMGVRLQGSGYVTSSHEFVSVDPEDIKYRKLSLPTLLQMNPICNSSVLVEVSLLKAIGGLPTSYAVRGVEDYAAWLRLATVGDWHLVECPLVLYADSPETSMRGTNEFSVGENVVALWDFAHWLETHDRKVPRRVRALMCLGNHVLSEWAGRQHLEFGVDPTLIDEKL